MQFAAHVRSSDLVFDPQLLLVLVLLRPLPVLDLATAIPSRGLAKAQCSLAVLRPLAVLRSAVEGEGPCKVGAEVEMEPVELAGPQVLESEVQDSVLPALAGGLAVLAGLLAWAGGAGGAGCLGGGGEATAGRVMRSETHCASMPFVKKGRIDLWYARLVPMSQRILDWLLFGFAD